MKNGVLIIHNRPDSSFSQIGCSESDAGVSDQVNAVAESLNRLDIDYRVMPVGSIKEIVESLSSATENIVFNLVEAIEGSVAKASIVPSICLAFGKGFSGCDTLSLQLTTDKWHSKAVLAAAGLPVPQAILVQPGQKAKPSCVGPYIVKPVASDASEGIDNASIIKTRGAALNKAVGRIHAQFKQAAIIEQFIDGREFNITVLHKDGKSMVMPVAEIDFSAFTQEKPRIVGYEAKWKRDSFEFNNTPRVVPAKVSKTLEKQLSILAAQAASAVGCTDYCRVDFRVDKKNRPYILEVNANPDISPDAGLAAAIDAAGIKYHQFVKLCLDNAQGKREAKIKGKKVNVKKTNIGKAEIIRFTGHKDIKPVLRFLDETKFFRPEEMVIADEVITEAAVKGPDGHYKSYVLEQNGTAVGWVCWGPTPCTVGSFDIYWLGIAPSCQGQGLGRKLMDHAEEQIRAAGGRLYIVETSGRESYLPTRAFYERIGYTVAATIKDFYASGDDKIIYIKPAQPGK
jgi:D-alanine-D-alanine ligase